MSFRSCEYRLAEGEKPLLPVDRVHKPFFFFTRIDNLKDWLDRSLIREEYRRLPRSHAYICLSVIRKLTPY